MKNSKQVYIIAALFIIGGFFYLIFSSITETSVYFLNVSEALATGKENIKHIRLFGKVGNDIKVNKNYLEFSIIDKKDPSQKITVKYHGKKPDIFGIGSEVIVEGEMKNGILLASQLMTKCPSKYKKREG